MKYKSTAYIEDGLLKLRNSKEATKFCQSLNCAEFTVTFEKKKAIRSLEQNAYYHAVVVPIVRQVLVDLGNNVDLVMAHEFIKSEFNSLPIVNEKNGVMMNIPQSTTELTKSAFSEMVAKIQIWCMEWGNVYLPDPNEQIEIDYR